jgi:hypothetical protein
MAIHLADDRAAGYRVSDDVIVTLVFDSEHGTLQGMLRHDAR